MFYSAKSKKEKRKEKKQIAENNSHTLKKVMEDERFSKLFTNTEFVREPTSSRYKSGKIFQLTISSHLSR